MATTYLANFNYPSAVLGIVLNVDVSASEDEITSLTLYHQGTSTLINEDDVPRHELGSIYDAAHYEIDMQIRAAKERGGDISDRIWDVASSMNREMVDWLNSDEWGKK